MIYGRKAVLPGTIQLGLDQIATNPDSHMTNLTRRLINLHKVAFIFNDSNKRYHFERYNIQQEHLINIGDKVLLLRSRSKEPLHKFSSNFIGPFEVIQKIGNSVYSLRKCDDGKVLNRVHKKFIRLIPGKQEIQQEEAYHSREAHPQRKRQTREDRYRCLQRATPRGTCGCQPRC